MNSRTIVQKLKRKRTGRGQSRARSPAHEQTVARSKSRFALRDDGLFYGDYVEQETPSPQPSQRANKRMADEQSQPPFSRN